jgi:ribosomal-protein-alanine N-acetyltransferase
MIFKAKDFILRPIELSDAKAYLKIMQDKESRKGFMSTPKNLKEVKEEIKESISKSKSKPVKGEKYAIEIEGEFAGSVGIGHLNNKFHEHYGNIGYALDRKFRGKGITSKALKILVKYWFKKYKLKRIEGTCRTFNKASAKVLEKAGFKLEGILKKNKFKDGKYLDDMIWAKVK